MKESSGGGLRCPPFSVVNLGDLLQEGTALQERSSAPQYCICHLSWEAPRRAAWPPLDLSPPCQGLLGVGLKCEVQVLTGRAASPSCGLCCAAGVVQRGRWPLGSSLSEPLASRCGRPSGVSPRSPLGWARSRRGRGRGRLGVSGTFAPATRASGRRLFPGTPPPLAPPRPPPPVPPSPPRPGFAAGAAPGNAASLLLLLGTERPLHRVRGAGVEGGAGAGPEGVGSRAAAGERGPSGGPGWSGQWGAGGDPGVPRTGGRSGRPGSRGWSGQ